jgi:enamidase
MQDMVRRGIGQWGLAPESAIALASGNAARAYRLSGGVLTPGQPADIVIAGVLVGSGAADGLHALASGEWLAVSMVLTDGEIRFHGEAWPGPARSPARLVTDGRGVPSP